MISVFTGTYYRYQTFPICHKLLHGLANCETMQSLSIINWQSGVADKNGHHLKLETNIFSKIPRIKQMPVFHSLTLASSLAQQQVFHWCMWLLSLDQWGLEWLVEWVKTKATDAKHTDYISDGKVAE